MLKLTYLAVIGCLATPLMAQNAAQKAQSFYQSGIEAEKAGDPATARRAYVQALSADPGHANARYRLGELKTQSGNIAARGREAKFNTVVIPVLQLSEASLAEALEAINLQVKKSSNDTVAPNFVVQDPQGLLSSKRVTLQLKNIPAKAAMDYVLNEVAAKARYDEHAIVIVPR